jgi:hypothetical protein
MEWQATKLFTELDKYREEYPKFYDTFKQIIKEKCEAHNIKMVYLSKDLDVKSINFIENGVSATKFQKELKKLSVFAFSSKIIFEFELQKDRFRYDLVLLKSIERVEVIRNEGMFTLVLQHALSSQAVLSILRAYDKEEGEQLLDIESFVNQKVFQSGSNAR